MTTQDAKQSVSPSSETVALELLKIKLEDRQKLQGDFFRVGTMFIVILGAALKFSLDESTPDEYRIVLSSTGILISLGVLMAIWFGNDARKTLESEIADLNSALNSPLSSANEPRLKYALVCAAYFTIVICVALAYVAIA